MKRKLILLRMADLLWEHYTRAGLLYAISTSDNPRWEEFRVRKSIAFNTYTQFCRKYGI